MKARVRKFLGLAVLLGACRAVPDGFTGPDKPWAELGHEERVAYMTSTVSPKMAGTFQGFDPERFADFGCRTCHGPGADDGSYAMPNPELSVLNRKTFHDVNKQHREMVRFMWEHVEIEAATLLGQKTGRKKFSCRTCHPHE